ncbi:3-oxoacyl-[acyl-carrier-protein] reductase [Leadbettera azotonutricia]|uniref:3-oxoacyl-[acyl-carrier-protein] reductase n=1 Tax=Leadbettera azotonutricia (strain ATCC BAA-888 / DSM 13862 / ZAS-9) TaxID=545695 RepID=F5Y6P9_LEAAZ|nr:3-oxoacyl-[acyl-carrier-protein] reductase [Leadbettera azotonutricia]AEF81500.1 3-oxoacyl-[acyl-carrier-protein] reductase [Leadbettera azotonutricia ZAS-9]
MELQDKKALVTGASRGIGRAIADRFIAAGAEVWGIGTKEPEDMGERIEKASGRLHWVSADLGDLAATEKLAESLLKESGGFDILVNNAGITRDNLSFRMTLDDFQKVLDVNLTAAFLISRTIGRDMIRRRAGSIINMSSVVGIHGNGGQANYSASKAGLIGLTKSLAQEVASRGVRVNAIAPGFIASDMTNAMAAEAKEKTIEHIPLKRIGQPEDIAEAALFLASASSSYITGQIIAVDGGMFI